ncbi:hypothetical protein CHGG_02249 [Chaetomium globosum CBS 148.51]|uniref:Methyltransferase type 11 domain-containing protein n=1 Tax=Chaetomium globosum (strain ATCC 6205 / CBS 148.51 / DSM 1962 / NBRC 6347 / NRRL 1970) TaxID=306901 RepID=Q2HC05_CHAGB|nr:uncharacterized protein CHGG_02249 [Chaetomium globosum CBS 148.51]EAQ90314.1 hypothetical protein CHGG_02249 [Chaetomium globosum CBS 148.51]
MGGLHPRHIGATPGACVGVEEQTLTDNGTTAQPITPADSTDTDSSYDSDLASSTNSLTTSILAYRTIQGRTFHSDRTPAEYWYEFGPENAGVNLCPMHAEPVTDKLIGIWAIDFADAHPGVEVIGTDISPIQPGWVPPNLQFEMEDATQPWTFAAGSFDFVHIRYMFGSVADWDALFAEAYRVLRPGGYIETFEADARMYAPDGTVLEGSPLDQWGKVFREGGKKFGRTFMVVGEDLQRKGLEAAGFVDLVQQDFKVPITAWAADKKNQEIGAYNHLSLEQDMEGLILYMFQQVMGWSTTEIHAYIAHLRRQLRDKSSYNIHVADRVAEIHGGPNERKLVRQWTCRTMLVL